MDTGGLHMKTRTIAFIAAASVVLVACLVVLAGYYYVQWFHNTYIVNAPYTQYSESNGDFVLKTKEIVCDDGKKAVTYYVENTEGKCIYECDSAWRLWDFKGAHFQTGSNNIIVESGDVGTVIYKYSFSNGSDVWTKTEYPGSGTK